MHHKVSIISILLIHLLPIECQAPRWKCQRLEKFVSCAKKTQATCRTLTPSGSKVCGGHCVCERDWLVRNDEGKCIPLWECPNLCPKNARMNFSVNPYQQLCFKEQSMIRELKKPPQIGCSCIENHSWLPDFSECIPTSTCIEHLQHWLIRFG